MTICSNPNKYADKKLQTAASLTMAKMMMVSSRFCEDHIQLLVTVLEKSTEPVTRSNLIVALGDLSYRFPNIIVPWTSHIYGRWEIHTTCLCYVWCCSPVSALRMLHWSPQIIDLLSELSSRTPLIKAWYSLNHWDTFDCINSKLSHNISK